MNTEHKFIIVRIKGRLYHFKGKENQDHFDILLKKGLVSYSSNAWDLKDKGVEIIEKGIISDFLQVWECYDKKHLHKIKTKTPDKWLGFDVEDYQETLKREWWR